MDRRFLLRGAVCVMALGCGGSAPDTSPATTPPTWAGEYVLRGHNGSAIPADLGSGVVVDTGTAVLWPSGYYELWARLRTSSGNFSNLVVDEGHWSSLGTTLQLTGTQSRSVSSNGSGDFSVNVTSFSPYSPTPTLAFHRVGDAPPAPVRPFNKAVPFVATSSLLTSGAGLATTVTATMTINNPDIIPRTLEFQGQCALNFQLSIDSTSLNWGGWIPDWNTPHCLAPATDTIAAKGAKTYRVVYSATELLGSPHFLPAGRYYAWLWSELNPAYEPMLKIGLGWITLSR